MSGVETFCWLNITLQMAGALWLTCLVRRIDFAAEERAKCDKRRADGFGYCTDCSPDHCRCWNQEQDRRTFALLKGMRP